MRPRRLGIHALEHNTKLHDRFYLLAIYENNMGLFDKFKKFDKFGYDKDGYDCNGYDKDGYNKKGYNKNGYDPRWIQQKGLQQRWV